MSAPVVFDGVWKKFSRGERLDSLRNMIPALARRLTRRTPRSDELEAKEFWALRDVSFEVAAGEALGIIGSNGAGKSTALKLLTRILKPNRGQSSVRGRVGALIEVAAGFHPDLTGRENVYLQGAIMGMRRAEIVSKLDEIVEFAGVAEFIDTPVKRYSSGMNARLGFSIAAHLNPDVLLIDEVLSVGDASFQQKCQDRMREYRNQGAAIVFVSHNLQAIVQLCSRALLLDHGAVAAIGQPGEVIASYTSGSRGPASGSGESASLRVTATADGQDTFSVVEPRQTIRLKVEVEFHAPVERASIGVVVWDVTRQLYVYGVSSQSIGLEWIRASSGDRRAYKFSLEANLTRGVYAFEVNVFDHSRMKHLALLMPAAQFSVAENVSYDGIANLYLQGRLQPAPVDTLVSVPR